MLSPAEAQMHCSRLGSASPNICRRLVSAKHRDRLGVMRLRKQVGAPDRLDHVACIPHKDPDVASLRMYCNGRRVSCVV